MHSKLFKKSILIFLFTLSTIVVFSQTENTAICLDSLIIKNNPNLILNYKLNSRGLNKKGIDFTVKHLDRKDQNTYSLFKAPVKSIEAILVKNKLISLNINLEESNEDIADLEQLLTTYLGNYNTTASVKKGDQISLFFGENGNGFLLDAFLTTENNMGTLSVNYITKQYTELDKKMRQEN